MSVFKCKMCGGGLTITEGQTVVECEYCGSKQTIPALDDEKKVQLFSRANRLRFNCEFDKASGIYETIISDFPEEAEAYWGILLCKYGIEYVDDPATAKKIPTCHRSSFDSIFDDEAFDLVMENSDTLAKSVYREEAKVIENIRKGIVEVSSKEEPYDIFICYKETDENGNRTVDSAIAQDVYDVLTQKGYKVFFSRITLEDKLGVEYEPYIFAALNSAKVMLAFGTKYEYYDAVWVKNEWSRFLKIISADHDKYLIPCYKDIDAYDMPKEFAKLQSQDMGKVGAIQDLVRGIEKIIPLNKAEKETVVVNSSPANANVVPLLERVFLFLEDGKWQDANIYCEKVLDNDPKNAEAYLGKLMAELQVKNCKLLADCAEPFDNRDNFAKVIRFGDEALEKEIRGYIAHIKDRNETTRKQGIYDDAMAKMGIATTESDFKSAASTFGSIAGFNDADELKEQCLNKAEECRKNEIYDYAIAKMKIDKYQVALSKFESIIDWKDSRTKIDECNNKIEEIKIAEEKAEAEYKHMVEEARIALRKARTKKKKIAMIGTPIVAVIIAFLIVLNTVILPASNYKKALAAVDAGNYSKAYNLFNKCLGYKDTDNKILEIMPGYYKEKFANVKSGDIIKFGNYYQSVSTNKEEIEWRVLEVKDGKALIISDKALDCVQYNEEYTDLTWETCTLRMWLNDTFLSEAFSAGDQTIIADTKVTADANPDYDTDPGNDTTDKVFLLSITEIEKYFSSDDDMMSKPTDYAVSNGAYVNDDYDSCWWWLRSPGRSSNDAAYVRSYGGVFYYGGFVSHVDGCVRPALWIEIG